MFYYLHELDTLFGPLNIFSYITFRTLCAAATAFIVSLVVAPRMIRKLREINFGSSRKMNAWRCWIAAARLGRRQWAGC